MSPCKSKIHGRTWIFLHQCIYSIRGKTNETIGFSRYWQKQRMSSNHSHMLIGNDVRYSILVSSYFRGRVAAVWRLHRTSISLQSTDCVIQDAFPSTQHTSAWPGGSLISTFTLCWPWDWRGHPLNGTFSSSIATIFGHRDNNDFHFDEIDCGSEPCYENLRFCWSPRWDCA